MSLVTCYLSRYYKSMSLPRLNTKRYTLNTLNGFTLIELLVVISIIAILMAVATVSYLNAQQKGRDNRRKSDLKAVQQALEIYFNQNAKYPEEYSGGLIMCSGGSSGFAWRTGIFTCGTPAISYMNPLPGDPITTTTTEYYYVPDASFRSYKIFAKLENAKDQNLSSPLADCATGAPATYATSGAYYCVINP